MSSMGKRKRPGAWASAIARRSRSKGRAASAASVARRADKFLGQELKNVDYNYGATTISSTLAGSEADPAAGCLNAVAVGTDDSERDGRRAILKGYEIRGIVVLNDIIDATATPIDTVVRLMLIHDKQTNSLQFNAEDVLKDTGGVDVSSLRNLDFVDRFKILKDQTIQLRFNVVGGAQTNTTSNDYTGEWRPFHWKGSFSIPTTYKGDTAAVTDITDHSLHILAVATNGGASLVYQSRVLFVG